MYGIILPAVNEGIICHPSDAHYLPLILTKADQKINIGRFLGVLYYFHHVDTNIEYNV